MIGRIVMMKGEVVEPFFGSLKKKGFENVVVSPCSDLNLHK